jgi:hypothetical protein
VDTAHNFEIHTLRPLRFPDLGPRAPVCVKLERSEKGTRESKRKADSPTRIPSGASLATGALAMTSRVGVCVRGWDVFHLASAMAAASHASTGGQASRRDECSALCNEYVVTSAPAVVVRVRCAIEQSLQVQTV